MSIDLRTGFLRKPIRKRRTKPRRGPLRDPKYRAWVRDHFCELWIKKPLGYIPPWCYGMVEPAHTQNNGTSSKGPDSSCVPLCRKHHREYDAGRKAFEQKYGLKMREIAKELWERYQVEHS